MAAPGFYNEQDQNIYDNVSKFMPQSKYLRSAPTFNEPVVEEVEESEAPSFGIPNTNAFTNSGGDNDQNIRTDYKPNYDYRQYAEYEMNPSTADIKQMDMNQEFFYGPTPSQTQKFLSKAINYIPYVGPVKRGMQFLGNKLKGVMPVNERSILENELRGAGIYTDDIGRIVTGQGVAYNTPEGIMSGYAANQMTDKTFDKRTGTIGKALEKKTSLNQQQINDIVSEIEETGKYSGELTDEDLGVKNLFSNLVNVNMAKFNFNKIKNKSNKISEFEDPANIAAAESRAESKRQYDPAEHGPNNYGLDSAGKQSYDTGQGFGSSSVDGGPVSNKTGKGRTGFIKGGRIGFAGGGKDAGKDSDFGSEDFGGDKDDSREQYGAVGQYNTKPTLTGNNDGDNTFFNKPETLYKNTVLGSLPTGITTTIPFGRLSAILNLNKTIQDEDLEGKMQYDSTVGPINTSMSYDTINGPEFNANYTGNNYGINYNTDTGLSGGYSKQIGPGTFTAGGSLKPDGTFDTEARYGITFANGGLASIL